MEQVPDQGWEDPLEEEMASSPVFLPGESHGLGRLAGCSHKESDTTQQLNTHTGLKRQAKLAWTDPVDVKLAPGCSDKTHLPGP